MQAMRVARAVWIGWWFSSEKCPWWVNCFTALVAGLHFPWHLHFAGANWFTVTFWLMVIEVNCWQMVRKLGWGR